MKSGRLLFYAIIGTAALFTACKKKVLSGKTELHAFMYNQLTGEPIETADYRIFQYRSSYTEWAGTKIDEIATGTLINGKIDETFKCKRGAGWVAILEFPYLTFDYYYYDHNLRFVLDKFQENNLDIPVIPLSDVSFHAKNTDCLGETDSMSFNIRHTLLDPESKVSPTEGDWDRYFFTGCEDRLLGPDRLPAGEYEIVMRVVKDGVVTFVSSTATLEGGVHNTVDLFY